MKKEIFSTSVEEALKKAERLFGVSSEKMSYQVLEETFGAPFKQKKIAIIVEVDDSLISTNQEKEKLGTDTTTDLTPEEKTTREAGDNEWAIFLVQGIMKRMGLSTETTAEEKGENVILTVRELSKFDIDLRCGESRELRGAIQHIVNRAVSKAGEDGRRFIVDIGGTLGKRSEQISGLASELVERVVRLGEPVHIHLMDSQDRRLLHLALLERPGTQTQGRGEKQYRILTVEPTAKP